jgi:hypothetical protein
LTTPRPTTIPIVAGFLFLATVIACVVGVSSLFPNPLMNYLWKLNPQGAELFRAIGKPAGVFLLSLAVGTLTAGRALLRGEKWAWWFAVVLFTIDGLGDVVSYFVTRDVWKSLAGVLITSAFLLALTRPNVRHYF